MSVINMKSSRRLGSIKKARFIILHFKCTNNSNVVGLITHVFKVI